ncbi:hypothetical protein HPB50_020307 [Hyalomma asiaticum]|uniref:Uncharacterized protein n=1 Tax=Hyalomma asiaticum TaxID=266040 RepID=A0ACB7RKF2_HYAAI|nr:hypothetical protein HPB50_020307 [Hyalomma asiaticum]
MKSLRNYTVCSDHIRQHDFMNAEHHTLTKLAAPSVPPPTQGFDPIATQSAGEDEIVVDSVWVAASLKADGYEVIVDRGQSLPSSCDAAKKAALQMGLSRRPWVLRRKHVLLVGLVPPHVPCQQLSFLIGLVLQPRLRLKHALLVSLVNQHRLRLNRAMVLQEQVAEAIQSPRAAPPAPAPLSYAEVAAQPPQQTFSAPPFVVPSRPVHPVYASVPVPHTACVHPTIARSATSVVYLVTWGGFATVA